MPTAYPTEIAQLVRLYRGAMGDLAGMVKSGTVFQEGRSIILMKRVTEALRPLDPATAKWAARMVPKAYSRGASEAISGLRALGIRGPLEVGFDRIHQDAVGVIAKSITRDLGQATREAKGLVGRIIRKTQQRVVAQHFIDTEVGKAVIKGATRRDLTKAVRSLFDRAGDRKSILDLAEGRFIRVGRKTLRLDHYCELVARTETRDAMVKGTINRLNENGYDLVIVTGPPTDCEICAEFVGQVYSISGTHPRYPALAEAMGGPPYHPNCEHGLGAYVEGLSRQPASEAA